MASKPKLTPTQLSHALNRVASLYTAAMAPYATTHATAIVVDWENPTAVDAFVKKYRLPTVTYREVGYMVRHGCWPNDFFYRFNQATAAEVADINKGRDGKLAKAAAVLGKAQDALIFSDGPDESAIPAFLERFSSDLRASLA